MNNKQIVTLAVVVGVAAVVYLAWKKNKTTGPVVTAPGSSNPSTTPAPAGPNDVASGIVDIVTDAWNDLGGLFGNQGT